ncbi:MAG: phosphoenolpyruvate carboxykinase (ATP) [Anaerolineae bacterium]|jgi:phosphoenolpyruvate carboxykinase (ATP)|nr:phosphoenolpyruvate carboxykinase (ATP) [Anaerolineae bacterium]MBT4311450.1 phosphoenolpyruvate carboxykinase (ATP) [Anaerolineae bacterium]MBT4458630.1 phosphoenolpyruvate carboxykinase (ATP) [Anaerolineae bacterium]MBT6060109.1 phosphoenolpyruvate carboxykinase (ATP) [Anaerolineae bacterium]MBT6322156.1 phosphoenolpyruvate carboxykinase (ATP) [Anaerolineae bacterium]
MNNIFNVKTPAEKQAAAMRSDYGLKNIGLSNLRKAYWNLPPEALYEEIIFRGEGNISHQGPIIVETGKHTARAANDKYVVREASTEGHVWWSEYNRPYSTEKFDELFGRLQGYLQGRDVFVQDCYAGADEEYRLPVRVITEYAWHSLFAQNMLVQPESTEEHRRHMPEFTVIAVPEFKSFPQIDQTVSDTFIVLNFSQKIAIIGNSGYGGEIKKAIFTVMNYLLPLEGVMAMHCSANQGDDGDVALFFGLSGTGKTTLSADPSRGLIGDDEHGWSDSGIFNFEGGCYAKVIELSASAEPQIHACTQRFGSILENVVYDPVTRLIDLDDPTLTVNTRISYPLQYIDNAVLEKRGGHPENVIFLTCDASGVMPPISKLSLEQAMYHFISGYTSKVGGTELGLREEPEITFSACFGAPFMVHHPYYYANLLKRKIEHHGATCWLVNTGWVGGPYGIGKRISIHYTRAILNAALEGKLNNVEYITDPIFGFFVPKTCPAIPNEVLDPASSWDDVEEYEKKYKQLALRFVDNFKKFAPDCPPELVKAGPKF